MQPAPQTPTPPAPPKIDLSWKDKVEKALGGVSNYLFGVSNAARTLGQTLGGLGKTFNAALDIVKGFADKYVGLFNPAAVAKFELATNDLYASIGEALLPVLDKATMVVRTVADSIAELGPTGRLAIAVLGGAAVGLGVTAAAAAALAVAINSATLGIPALIAGVVGVGAGAAFALSSTQGLSKVLGAAKGIITGALNALGAFADTIGNAVGPAIGAVTGAFAAALKTVTGVFGSMGSVIGGAVGSLSGAFGSVLGVFAKLQVVGIQVGAALGGVFYSALAALGPVFEVLATAVNVVVTPLRVAGAVVAALGSAVTRAVGTLSGTFGRLQSSLRPALDAVEKAMEAIVNAAGGIAESVGGSLVSAFSAALPFIEKAADIFGKVIVRVANAIEFVCEVMNGLIQIAKDFGLLDDENARPIERENKKHASENKSIRNVNLGAVQDAINRSYVAAFSSAGATDFQSETARNTATAARHLGTLVARGNKQNQSQQGPTAPSVYDRIGESQVGQALLDWF